MALKETRLRNYSGSIDEITIFSFSTKRTHIRIILLAFVFASSSRNHCAKRRKDSYDDSISKCWDIFLCASSLAERGRRKENWNNLWICCCYCLVCTCYRVCLPEYFSSQSHRLENWSEKMEYWKKHNRMKKSFASQEKHIYEVQMILKSVCDSFFSPFALFIFVNFCNKNYWGCCLTPQN